MPAKQDEKRTALIRSLSAREMRIFVFCLTLIVGSAGYHFILRPLKENIVDLENKIIVHEKRLRKNLGLVKQKASIDTNYSQYAALLKQNASQEQQMALIIDEIGAVANQVQLRVSDIKPKKVRPVDFYNNFTVSLSVEGELKTILHFLYILQSSPHLFAIDELYIEKGTMRSVQVRCRLSLSKALVP